MNWNSKWSVLVGLSVDLEWGYDQGLPPPLPGPPTQGMAATRHGYLSPFCKMQLIIVPNGGGGGVGKEVSWSQWWETAPICIRIRAFKHSYIINLKKLKKLSVLQFHRWKTLFLLCENNGIKLLNTNPVWIRIHNSGWNVVQPTSWFECCWYYCVALTRAKSCWATWRRCTSPPAGTSSGPFSGSSRYYYWIAKL